MTNLQYVPVPLRTIQRWLQSVVIHPQGIEAGLASSDALMNIEVKPDEIERVILPSNEMTSLDRISIYSRAYFGRLLECLRAQYPAMQYAIGDEAFDGLAFGYLTENPSQRYTLSSLGDSFERYLTATRPPRAEGSDSNEPDFADFLIDLARLERLYNVVFDGPGPERSRSLSVDDFAGLSPERFADSRLRLHESVRLIELRFPVHEYATAIRRGLEPAPPASRPVHLVITRRDYIVRRFEITELQYQLLFAIQSNSTICEALLSTTTSINPTDLQKWFQSWTAAPLFAELISNSA